MEEVNEQTSPYEPLTCAMDALRGCTSEYTGEQAHAVAKLLKQWNTKFLAESDHHGRALDRIAALEAESERLTGEIDHWKYLSPSSSAAEQVRQAEQQRGRVVRDNELLMALYDELKGCTWKREDGGENKLAVAMANLERHFEENVA